VIVRFHSFLLIFLVVLVSIPARAGEDAVLASGLRLHADRHEQAGEVMRLYRGAGVIEVPVAAIVGFEADEIVAAVPAVEIAPVPVVEKAAVAVNPKTLDPKALVHAAAQRNGLPTAFVESVAKTESGFDPHAVSPKGALGVMQLMPGTAKTRLLRELLLKYGGDVSKALAAYNAGEAAVDRYQGVPPYAETQHYVNVIVRDYLKSGGALDGSQ
jgi:soluble lytic murein transglycosylase-like protein